jgi:REP element-mobilizing transposase RayT
MSNTENPRHLDTSGGRRTIRLSGSAYIDGVFFVTICAYQRQHIFGRIAAGDPPVVERSPLGELITCELLRSPALRPELSIDMYIVMPNHLHAILWLASHRETARFTDQRKFARLPGSLSSVIAGFKASVSSRARRIGLARGHIWQRNYFERVIRNDGELDALRRYVDENPLRWVLKASGQEF